MKGKSIPTKYIQSRPKWSRSKWIKQRLPVRILVEQFIGSSADIIGGGDQNQTFISYIFYYAGHLKTKKIFGSVAFTVTVSALKLLAVEWDDKITWKMNNKLIQEFKQKDNKNIIS